LLHGDFHQQLSQNPHHHAFTMFKLERKVTKKDLLQQQEVVKKNAAEIAYQKNLVEEQRQWILSLMSELS
jgi:hypothetical protein